MTKTDSIARKIFGWKLNRWDRWYDYESGKFIHESEFQPEQNLDHAMLIVDKLQEFGYKFNTNGRNIAQFNHISASGETLPQAITNAAYSIIEQNSVIETRNVWFQMC